MTNPNIPPEPQIINLADALRASVAAAPAPVQADRLITAMANIDWVQFTMNGGGCFHLDPDGSLCGRAIRWPGHQSEDADHLFVPLHVAATQLAKSAPAPVRISPEVQMVPLAGRNDAVAQRDRAESELDAERKMRIEAEAAATRAEAESATFSRRLAEALVRNDEDDLGCDRARMEEMRDERDALKAQEGEWADQISAALNSTADKLGRTPSMIAGHVRREHEAHTACFDRLRKAVDERDALKARLGNIECLHCGDIDPDVSHWEQCKEHPARATVDALKAKLAARSEKDSHSWHELYKDTKAKLAALVKAADPFACDQGCDAVHHPVKDRHDQRDNCPVVARLRAAIAAARGGAS